MPEREVHSFSPSAETVSDSWMITAAEPLSWISAIFVVVVAVPEGRRVRYELADPPQVMALSAGSPSVSLRDALTEDGRPALLVGGFGHGDAQVAAAEFDLQLLDAGRHGHGGDDGVGTAGEDAVDR